MTTYIRQPKELPGGIPGVPRIDCVSVVGGWTSRVISTGRTFGPICVSTIDLWDWQRVNWRLIAQLLDACGEDPTS